MKISRRSIIYLAVTLGTAALFLPGYTRIQDLRDKISDLDEKNRRLNRENTLLEQQITRIQKDRVFQEKILREKMGVVRKDEIPVKVITGD